MMWVVLLAALAALPQQRPSPPGPAGRSSSAQAGSRLDPEELPVSIERIQRALSQPPAIRLESDGRPVFRVEVFGRKPTIEDILGPEFWRGAVKGGGMTHQEFLNMVTPRDVQGYAAFSNKEAITVATTSFALKWALQKAVQKFKEAQTDRQREAARKEVEDALADLDRARARAGLPPR